MKLNAITTRSDIETPRRAIDFVTWYEALLDRIRIEPDHELREQVLMRSGLAKVFYEELFPIYRLMQIKAADWTDVEVTPVLGNQNYDARIVCRGTRPTGLPDWLEVTCVVDGRDDKFRMRHLVDHGITSMTGAVKTPRERGRAKVEIDDDVQSCDDTVAGMLRLLEKRIVDKVAKIYPANTALILFVESHGTFRDKPYQSVLQDFVKARRAELRRVFPSVFLFTSLEGFLGEYSG
jgi:hypothetical protein